MRNVILFTITKIEIHANFMHLRLKNDFINASESDEFIFENRLKVVPKYTLIDVKHSKEVL